jgi:hypothetical protein
MVDGVLVELTPEEIAQLEADAAKMTQQQSVGTPDPGAGPSFKDTLSPPPAMPR